MGNGKKWKRLSNDKHSASSNVCALSAGDTFFSHFRIQKKIFVENIDNAADILVFGGFEIYGFVKNMNRKQLSNNFIHSRNKHQDLSRAHVANMAIIKSMNDKIREQDEEIIALQKESKDKDSDIVKLENKAKESEQKYEKMLALKKDIERSLKNKCKEIKDSNVLHEREVSKCSKLRKKYEKKKETIQKLKSEKSDIECKYEEMQKKYEELENKYKSLENDKDDILFDLNAMQQYGQDMFSNYHQLKEKCNLQRDELHSLRNELSLQCCQHNNDMIKMEQRNKILAIKSKKIQNDYRNLQIKYNSQRKTFGFLEWTTENVADFIVNVNYQKYCKYYDHLLDALMNEGVDGECLHNLDKDDLHRFGIVAFKDKQNILNAIKSLVRNKYKNRNEKTKQFEVCRNDCNHCKSLECGDGIDENYMLCQNECVLKVTFLEHN